MPDLSDWEQLGVRVGTVLRCETHEGARDPAYRLWIDVDEPELHQSSAKLTERYRPSDLVGRQVIVVTGLEPLRVGGFRSDVLVLGLETPEGVVLISPATPVPNGTQVT